GAPGRVEVGVTRQPASTGRETEEIAIRDAEVEPGGRRAGGVHAHEAGLGGAGGVAAVAVLRVPIVTRLRCQLHAVPALGHADPVRAVRLERARGRASISVDDVAVVASL